MENENKTRSGRTTSVLVVDDNEVIRRVLKGIVLQDNRLKYLGEAAHGESALSSIKKYSPDIVCLDLEMPGVNGLGVLEQIRDISTGTRTVVITGYATSETVAKAKALGAAGFVVKPFNAAKVLAAIHAAASAPQRS
jgi:two-component system chemotaxis response regulator CheY